MQTMATFRLRGSNELTATAVTQALQLTPTASFEAGEQLSTRSAATRSTSLWLLQSTDEIEDDVELSTQLERLLLVLEPVGDRLWGLVQQGYEANWFCFVGSELAEHAVELDRSLLSRLLTLPGDLWIDVASPDALP